MKTPRHAKLAGSSGVYASQTLAERRTWRAFQDGWTYRLMFTRCGKCRACKAGIYAHGPYWFAEKIRTRGMLNPKIITRYVGKTLRPVEGRT
jgi:hypothetical protein